MPRCFTDMFWRVQTYTPLKINMEHNHGGLVQIIFLSKLDGLYVLAVNLPGCTVVVINAFLAGQFIINP